MNDKEDILNIFHLLTKSVENSKKIYKIFIKGNIQGPALEIALACDYRLAKNNANLLFPELNIGLMPFGGSLQRLLRHIGIENTIKVIFNESSITYKKGLELNLLKNINEKITLPRKNIFFKQMWNSNFANTFLINNSVVHANTSGKKPLYKALSASIYEGQICGYTASLSIERKWNIWLLKHTVTSNILELLYKINSNYLNTDAIFKNNNNNNISNFSQELIKEYALTGVKLLEDGCSAPLIENSAILAGFNKGPLSTADSIGTKYFPDLGLTLSNMGREGVLKKKGFYEYINSNESHLWPNLNQIIKKNNSNTTDMIQNILLKSVAEKARNIQKFSSLKSFELDFLSIREASFPFWTGGPLRFLKIL